MLKFVTLAAIIAVIAVPAAGAVTGKLVATDGPGFVISVKQGGKNVKTLKAGTYTITVQDKSNIHDFHLKGPGVNKIITATPFQGSKTVTVTLKKGKYTYVCDPHATVMKGSFTVK